MPAYARPNRLEEALRLVAAGGQRLLAGGTDYYPGRVGKPLNEDVVDLTALPELRGIAEHADHWRIGATTTWREVGGAQLPPWFRTLQLAAREVGGQQIQNAGTVAGNLCNASPAADGVPPLMALDASVELASVERTRSVPLQQFIIGPRQTVLAPNELLCAIRVPKPRHPARSGFLKLGARKYLVISIAMVAAMVEHESGVVRSARIAVGACSPVARRLPSLERALVGLALGADLAAAVHPEHLAPLAPIDDARASAEYRMAAACTLLERVLRGLA
jgi:CO/xanthine dehydrogenase FAD-binding subunit